MITAAAPAFWQASASAAAGASDAPAPRRIFTVSGRGTPSAMPRTSRSSLAGFLSSFAPRPRFQVSCIGHPQFRSKKSAPLSNARRPALTPSAIWLVAICTPKIFSDSCLRRRASSTGLRFSAYRAKTISLTVTLHPSSTHRRRNGKFPPFVSGASMSSFAMDARNAAIFSSVTTRSTVSMPSGMSLNCLRPSTCGLLGTAGASPSAPAGGRLREMPPRESRVGVATDTRVARARRNMLPRTPTRAPRADPVAGPWASISSAARPHE